jgi:hypothetical protein
MVPADRPEGYSAEGLLDPVHGFVPLSPLTPWSELTTKARQPLGRTFRF